MRHYWLSNALMISTKAVFFYKKKMNIFMFLYYFNMMSNFFKKNMNF